MEAKQQEGSNESAAFSSSQEIAGALMGIKFSKQEQKLIDAMTNNHGRDSICKEAHISPNTYPKVLASIRSKLRNYA